MHIPNPAPVCSDLTFILACGGTGGHLMPGIAVAQGLKRAHQKIILAVSYKPIDDQILKNYPDLPAIKIPSGSLSRNWIQCIRHIWRLGMGFVKAWKLVRAHRPCVVVGFGGFSNVPLLWAACCLKQKIVLHEANQRMGRVVRFFARWATIVFVPDGFNDIQPPRLQYLGLPLRDEVQLIDLRVAREKLNLPIDHPLLVIFGGSQGASCLTAWAKEHAAALAAIGLHTVCVTGQADGHSDIYHPGPNQEPYLMRFMGFCADMPTLICAANLAIARSGAGSIAELIHLGVPSILIPYPHAQDQHQQANAQYVEGQQAALLLDQKHMNGLYDLVVHLIRHPEDLLAMKKACFRLSATNARDTFVEQLLHL